MADDFIESEETKEEGFDKPSYDGRLEYYKVLKAYMLAVAKSSSTEDFSLWLRMLRGMFALVKSFIKESDAVAIKSRFISIKNQLMSMDKSHINAKTMMARKIDDELQDVTEDIFEAAKHLLLPLSSDSIMEFNEDEFVRGSDL